MYTCPHCTQEAAGKRWQEPNGQEGRAAGEEGRQERKEDGMVISIDSLHCEEIC